MRGKKIVNFRLTTIIFNTHTHSLFFFSTNALVYWIKYFSLDAFLTKL